MSTSSLTFKEAYVHALLATLWESNSEICSTTLAKRSEHPWGVRVHISCLLSPRACGASKYSNGGSWNWSVPNFHERFLGFQSIQRKKQLAERKEQLNEESKKELHGLLVTYCPTTPGLCRTVLQKPSYYVKVCQCMSRA